jgi:hypothetical protein
MDIEDMLLINGMYVDGSAWMLEYNLSFEVSSLFIYSLIDIESMF